MTTLIGAVGASIILTFFLLAQSHKTSIDSIWFGIGNLIGSSLLMVYAYMLHSIPFWALNGVWALVSLNEIISNIEKKRKKRKGHSI